MNWRKSPPTGHYRRMCLRLQSALLRSLVSYSQRQLCLFAARHFQDLSTNSQLNGQPDNICLTGSSLSSRLGSSRLSRSLGGSLNSSLGRSSLSSSSLRSDLFSSLICSLFSSLSSSLSSNPSSSSLKVVV